MKKRYTLKYKRSHGRRRSTIHVTDSYTNVTEILHMEESIGKGGYGTIRLFSNQAMRLAVKKNLLDESFNNEEEARQFKQDVKREYTLTKTAYPDDFYKLKTHQVLDIDTADEDIILVDYRFVMPYIKGTDLFELDFTALSSEHIIKLFIRIAQELLRIHKLGIIHGDVSVNNIKYQLLKSGNEFKIRFLDFGLAHRDSDYANLACPDTMHLAPEINQEEPLLANANQDVYSLAGLFDKILSEIPDTRGAIEDSYPRIRKFIITGRDIQPDKRPQLESFIAKLALEILDQSREDCGPKLKRLVRAVFTNNKKEIADISSSADDEMEREIIKLISLLITHHFYTEASFLLNADLYLLQRHKHHTTKLIEESFADKHLPVFLFTQLLDSISKEHFRDRLLCTKKTDFTPIQYLAKNDRRDLLKLLFKHLSWHNIYTLSDEHLELIDSLSRNSLNLLVDIAIFNAEYEIKVENELGENALARLENCPSNKYFRLSGELLAALLEEKPEFDAETIQQIKSDEILNKYYKRLKSCLKQHDEESVEYRRAHHRK